MSASATRLKSRRLCDGFAGVLKPNNKVNCWVAWEKPPQKNAERKTSQATRAVRGIHQMMAEIREGLDANINVKKKTSGENTIRTHVNEDGVQIATHF